MSHGLGVGTRQEGTLGGQTRLLTTKQQESRDWSSSQLPEKPRDQWPTHRATRSPGTGALGQGRLSRSLVAEFKLVCF